MKFKKSSLKVVAFSFNLEYLNTLSCDLRLRNFEKTSSFNNKDISRLKLLKLSFSCYPKSNYIPKYSYFYMIKEKVPKI